MEHRGRKRGTGGFKAIDKAPAFGEQQLLSVRKETRNSGKGKVWMQVAEQKIREGGNECSRGTIRYYTKYELVYVCAKNKKGFVYSSTPTYKGSVV